MRSVFVVVDPPFIDPGPCICHVQGLGSVQAFLPQTAVEGFNVNIIRWFSWPGEVQFDFVQIGPLVK